MEITVKPKLKQYVTRKITSGDFDSASDVVNFALDRLRQDEKKIDWFRNELKKGIRSLDRGEGTIWNVEAEKRAITPSRGSATEKCLMPPVIKSKNARRDIDEITLHIAIDSVDAVLKWYDELDDFFQRIAQGTGVGTLHASAAKDLRSVAMGNYLIFFRKVHKNIEIVRVIHGSRKWRRLVKKIN